MKSRDRILDAAMAVFRRHGFRRSSIEQAAEAAGLTRQALYHHFKSKEALFRAVIERLHESALAAEITAANAAEKAGGGLADILVAGVTARLRQFIASFDGSPHIEELFSEHLTQARDLYQKYAGLYAAHGAATIERLHESALAAEIAAVNAAEKAGGSLADILIAGVTARLRQFIASFDGSPHIEELFSEHLTQARDLYQKYAGLYAAHGAATIERLCRKQRLSLASGMTSQELARCVEMAINGAKSVHPGMQPADAFVGDLTTMARTLIAGAVAPLPKSRPIKPVAKKAAPKKPVPKKPVPKNSGGRK